MYVWFFSITNGWWFLIIRENEKGYTKQSIQSWSQNVTCTENLVLKIYIVLKKYRIWKRRWHKADCLCCRLIFFWTSNKQFIVGHSDVGYVCMLNNELKVTNSVYLLHYILKHYLAYFVW